MTDVLEYATTKHVRNNPIVRPVDVARHRDLWKSAAAAGAFVVMLLFWAVQQFELLRHGYRLEEVQHELVVEQDVGRHLRLEYETLRAPKRIEALAKGRLHLVEPSRDEAIVIERVLPAEPPATSVVARR